MLIGLSGKSGSGKDTVFQRSLVMAERMGLLPKPERLAFADKLKQSTSALLGISIEDLEHFKNDDPKSTGHLTILGKPMSIRTFLQRYGTESHRDIFGSDFWIDQTLPINFNHSNRIVIVTDVRFDNEARRIRNCGGMNFVIDRGIESSDSHVSESSIDMSMVEGIIDNKVDGDFSHLDRQIRSMLSAYSETVNVTEFGEPKSLKVAE